MLATTAMKNNPFKDRDLNEQLKFPVMSWSSFYAFTEYDKEEWYEHYYLGKKNSINSLMQGGIDVGEKITQDKKFLKKLPRPEIFEQEFSIDFNGIKLVGHLDGWSPSIPGIDEYKTSINPKRWNQKSVDEWRQLTWYCLLVFLNEDIKPEKIRLRLMYIPMVEHGDFSVKQNGDIKIFETKRTTLQVLQLGVDIKHVFKEMQSFIHSHS